MRASASELSRDLKLECADVRLRTADGGSYLAGFVASAEDEKRVRDHAARIGATLKVDLAPWPACEAMLALGDALRSEAGPALRTRSGKTTYRIGDQLVIDVTTPDFPAFVYVVYLQADGTVMNMLPRGDVIRPQHRPRWKLSLGEGPMRFKLAPPAGNEAVVALAARSPIAELEDLEKGSRPYRLALNSSSGKSEDRAFLELLRKAISARGNTGSEGSIVATVLPITLRE